MQKNKKQKKKYNEKNHYRIQEEEESDVLNVNEMKNI